MKTADYGMSKRPGGGGYGSGGYNNGGYNNRSNNNRGNFGGQSFNQPATAPYNFVPLAGKAVNSPLGNALAEGKTYADYINEEGILTGSIDIELVTLTPLCINDGGNFYRQNLDPVIPGSTLRGMIKNYLKILAAGTMRADGNEDLTSRHLYYRGLASACKEFREQYARKMTGVKKVMINGVEKSLNDSRASAGFLAQLEDDSYVIFPADYKSVSYPRKPNYNQRNDRDKWIYIVPNYLRNDKEGTIEPTRDFVNCHTGAMHGKGHYYRLSNVAWDRPMTVSPETIAEYKADKSRTGMNLLAKDSSIHKSEFAYGHQFKHLVPCFYLEKDGKVLHFGYGKYYRIPYDKSIEEHIPAAMRDENIVDFADALFGRKEAFAGRVFFEDAVYQSGGLLPKDFSHNLMEPRPTSFQLYLEQKGGLKRHWDDNVNIRGYKLYWHQAIGATDWHRSPEEKAVKGTTKIEPIGKNSVFKGSIRFERLSAVELGALLAVLGLAKEGCFKIGLGKSIGMGSVSLKYQLHLLDLPKRYSALFEGDGWSLGESAEEGNEELAEFRNYMQSETSKLGISADYTKSLETLAIMMSWDNKPAKQDLAYMPIGVKGDDRYKKRLSLPTPEQVVKSKGTKKC